MPGVAMANYPDGQLTLGSTSCHTHAWNIINLLTLWTHGDVAGDDLVFPHAGGSRPYGRRAAPTEHSLRMVFAGECDEDGNTNSDPWAGLWENVDTFWQATVGACLGTDRGVIDGSLAVPGASALTTEVHVHDLVLGESIEGTNQRTGQRGVGCKAVLVLSCPTGGFRYPAS